MSKFPKFEIFMGGPVKTNWFVLLVFSLAAGIACVADDVQIYVFFNHADLFEGLADATPGPEVRYDTRESVGLAFVAALQHLPPRQRAALVLERYPELQALPSCDWRRLSVHENTVTYRVQRAEELLGHPVSERRLELQVALRLVGLTCP